MYSSHWKKKGTGTYNDLYKLANFLSVRLEIVTSGF